MRYFIHFTVVMQNTSSIPNKDEHDVVRSEIILIHDRIYDIYQIKKSLFDRLSNDKTYDNICTPVRIKHIHAFNRID